MNDDELALSDYLDGRLAGAERAAFEARLAAEPALARRLKLLRAMKAGLAAGAPQLPADLKARLLRQARERGLPGGPSWLDALRASLGGGPWAYGAGAAFAAASLGLALWLGRSAGGPSGPGGEAGPAVGTLPAAAAMIGDPAVADGLRGLWSDDDGGEKDEG